MITLIDLFGVAVWTGMLTALALRLGAIRWHWGLPVFRI